MSAVICVIILDKIDEKIAEYRKTKLGVEE